MYRLPRARLAIPLSLLLKSLLKIIFIKLERSYYNERLEKSLASFWSSKYCITMPTCRIALYYVLKSLKLKKGDEVLLTPLVIPDIVNAIHMLGLKPVFVDLSLDDQNIDIIDLERKISAKSKVLLLTYLSGIVPDMRVIMEKIQKYNLILVEDISQNYGSTYNGRLIGTFGTASIGSFSAGKTIASLLGGFILTNDKSIINNVCELSSKELNRPSKAVLIKIIFGQIKISLATQAIIFSYVTYYIFRILSFLSPGSIFTSKKYSSKKIEKINYYENYPVLRRKFPAEALVWFSDLQAEIAIKTFENLERNIHSRRKLFETLYNNLDRRVLELMPHSLMNINQNVYWHIPVLLKTGVRNFQKRLLGDGFDITGFALRVCSVEPIFKEYYEETPNALLIKSQTVFLPIHESFTEKQMIKLAKSVNNHFLKKEAAI